MQTNYYQSTTMCRICLSNITPQTSYIKFQRPGSLIDDFLCRLKNINNEINYHALVFVLISKFIWVVKFVSMRRSDRNLSTSRGIKLFVLPSMRVKRFKKKYVEHFPKMFERGMYSCITRQDVTRMYLFVPAC